MVNVASALEDETKELMPLYQYKGDDVTHDSIIKTKQSSMHTCISPQCCSCLFANVQGCYPTGTHTYCGPESEGVLKLGDPKPGNTVSTDQYELHLHSCLSLTKGK
eukprot:2078118-Ditylum_brightwellii.AAC.1